MGAAVRKSDRDDMTPAQRNQVTLVTIASGLAAVLSVGVFEVRWALTPPSEIQTVRELRDNPYARPDAWSRSDALASQGAIRQDIGRLSGLIEQLQRDVEKFSEFGPDAVRTRLQRLQDDVGELKERIYQLQAERTRSQFQEDL